MMHNHFVRFGELGALVRKTVGAEQLADLFAGADTDFGDHFVTLRCPTLVPGDGRQQTWWGRTPDIALDRAEQDINRWCDNAMAERGGSDG